MPKHPRAVAPVTGLVPDEPDEGRRKKLRLALTVEQLVEDIAEHITRMMDTEGTTEQIRTWLLEKLLEHHEQNLVEGKNKELHQLTVAQVLTMVKKMAASFQPEKQHGYHVPSPEPSTASDDIDVVDTFEEISEGSDRDMEQDDEVDEEENDENNGVMDNDDEHQGGYDSNDFEDEDDTSYYPEDEEVGGYSDGSGWYCHGGHDWSEDDEESQNEEANNPDKEYVPSPWSVGDPSTPRDPFVEGSPQVDLLRAFRDTHGNRDSPDPDVVPLRNPAVLSLHSEADYENYYKRPRIDFGRPGWKS